MSCSQCGRPLRIRKEYVGQRLACKQCNHVFQVTDTGQAVSAPSPAQAAETEALRRRVAELEQELRQAGGLRDKLDAALAEGERLRAELRTHQDTAARAGRLEAELQASQAEVQRRAEAADRELQSARTEGERLDAQVRQLQGQAQAAAAAEREKFDR